MCDTNFEKWVARLYLSKLDQSSSRGIDFSINLVSLRNILRAKKCYWTGISLTRPKLDGKGNALGGNHRRASDITVDRIDSSLPYIKGNVVACSNYANSLKSVFEDPGNEYTAQHFIKMADKMRRLGAF